MSATSTLPETFVHGPRRATRSGELHLVRDEVAGLLAHDLRTPLAAISMNLDFILEGLEGEAETTRAALKDCREANLRAVRLVSDMSDAVQLASGERKPTFFDVDGGDILAEVVRRVATDAAGRDVQILWSAEGDNLHADPELLTRALERIVQRALWHSRCGGQIDIVLQSGNIAIRTERAPLGGAQPPVRSLATHFAETAIRAQGGAMWTETDAEGALVYKVQLERSP